MGGVVEWREMTDLEALAAKTLGACRFGAGHFDKKFVRNIQAQALGRSPLPGASQLFVRPITTAQAERLWGCCWSYRAQINCWDVMQEAQRHRLALARALALTGTSKPEPHRPARQEHHRAHGEQVVGADRPRERRRLILEEEQSLWGVG